MPVGWGICRFGLVLIVTLVLVVMFVLHGVWFQDTIPCRRVESCAANGYRGRTRLRVFVSRTARRNASNLCGSTSRTAATNCATA